jgi:hypothetical protein
MHLLHFVTGVVDDLDAAPPVAAGFVESPFFRAKKRKSSFVEKKEVAP